MEEITKTMIKTICLVIIVAIGFTILVELDKQEKNKRMLFCQENDYENYKYIGNKQIKCYKYIEIENQLGYTKIESGIIPLDKLKEK